MYDVWYVTGLAVMRPSLLQEINNAKPVFNFVQRLIVETEQGVMTTRPVAPQTGLLDSDATTRVRLAISKFAKGFSPLAPPIGIYCAGRFSQYANIPYFNSGRPADSKFSDIITLANQGYLKAVGAGSESTLPTFPAFVGACMMDGALAGNLDAPSQEQIAVAAEFGLTANGANRDWQIAIAFVGTQEFKDATQLLMLSDEDPWQDISEEQIFFWKGINERAIP